MWWISLRTMLCERPDGVSVAATRVTVISETRRGAGIPDMTCDRSCRERWLEMGAYSGHDERAPSNNRLRLLLAASHVLGRLDIPY